MCADKNVHSVELRMQLPTQGGPVAFGYLLGDLGQRENTSLHGKCANSVKALRSAGEYHRWGDGEEKTPGSQ